MVNLNDCKFGDKLLNRDGTISKYIRKLIFNYPYNHYVEQSNGAIGPRTKDGRVYDVIKNNGDIIKILKNDKNYNGKESCERCKDYELEKAYETIEKLKSALERIYPIPCRLLRGQIVRGLDEIILECKQILDEI